MVFVTSAKKNTRNENMKHIINGMRVEDHEAINYLLREIRNLKNKIEDIEVCFKE